MFGSARKKEEEKQVGQPPARPEAIIPCVGATPLGAYEALAGKLGFYPAQLLEEQLKRFLVEQKIPTYDYEKMDAYLTHIAIQQGKIWNWRPLRPCDVSNNTWDGHNNESMTLRHWDGHGCYHKNQDFYDKAVPIHILRRVEKIHDRFGNIVQFYVSDYAVAHPDPFIMVTASSVSKIVFGVWDEPAFDVEGAEE